MTPQREKPVLLMYALLLAHTALFIICAFELTQALRVLGAYGALSSAFLRSAEYILLGLFLIAVLVMLPRIERSFAVHTQAKPLLIASCRLLCLQAAVIGGLACLQVPGPLGGMGADMALLPVGLAGRWALRRFGKP